MAGPLVTVKGKVQWTDKAGNLHPVRGGWIELWEDDLFSDDLITGGPTNDRGIYEFTRPLNRFLDLEFPFFQEGEVYFYLRSEAFEYPFTVREYNKLADSLTLQGPEIVGPFDVYSGITTIASAGSYVIDLIIPNGNDMGKAFSILDAIYVGHQYGLLVLEEAETIDLNTGRAKLEPPQLDILYPYPASTSQYQYNKLAPFKHSMYILPSDWMDWDVILHEFGHYLAEIDRLGIAMNGSHTRGKSGIYQGKEVGMLMAWNEGLADYLSLAIQHVAASKGLLPKNLANVSDSNGLPDTFITARPHNININLENKNDKSQMELDLVSNPQGEGDEASVSRILWDLADKNIDMLANGLQDEISIGHEELYKILDREIAKGQEGNLKALQDLWNYLYANPEKLGLVNSRADERISKMGAIFEEYSVSPVVVSLRPNALNCKTSYPFLTWKPGNNNANDTFEIIVFNRDFSRKLIQFKLEPVDWLPGYKSNSGKIEWTPTSNYVSSLWSWNKLATTPGRYNIVIAGSDNFNEARDQYSPKERTGSYWSGARQFTVEKINTKKPNIFRGTNGRDVLTGTVVNDQLIGGRGDDRLSGGGGADNFGFSFGHSTIPLPDRITDFQFGFDKIDLLTASGAALPSPAGFSRASNNSTATTLSALAASVFADSNGSLRGNQALGANRAAVVVATRAPIAGTYLFINDGNATRDNNNDLLINITGVSGGFPGLGGIPVGSFFA